MVDVLVAGADGQLGRAVADHLIGEGLHVARGTHRNLELLDRASCREVVTRLEPATVIDCAQMHPRVGDGDDAVVGAHNLAAAARMIGSMSMYVSCAEVFDGYSDGPYLESSEAHPMTALGVAKLAAERAVAAANDHHALVRTSWLFGPGGNNVVEAVLAATAVSHTVPVDTGTRSCPTYTIHLAEAIAALVRKSARGLFHIVGGGSCTKLQLARNVLREVGSRARAVPLIASFNVSATRNLVLGTERPEVPRLADWPLALRMHLEAQAHQAH